MENDLKAIQERNKRVELDKAWEVSITRRTLIAFFTYVIATVWLFVIENENPFLSALIPTGGYILSTLSLPFVKQWWMARSLKE